MNARGFHAVSVVECWRIARNEARAFQRMLTKTPKRNAVKTAACLAARDAADRIALKIRYGTTSNVDNSRKRKR